mmetsp:Transcript_8185/g.22181  ORF Transcript_8185/g.22181 Transcript_8185/m.22181 type:complete len:223 (+) Transcript_8185:1712-2380(+)
MVQRVHDVHRSAVASGDGRHAVRGGFDDGQTERLLEGDVDKHPARVGRVQVNIGDVRLAVMLWVGDRAVQIVCVNQLQDLGENFLAASSHGRDVVPISHHQDEVGELPQHWMLAKCFDQRCEVLLGVGTRHCEHRRLDGIAEKLGNLLPYWRSIGDDVRLAMDLLLDHGRGTLQRRHTLVQRVRIGPLSRRVARDAALPGDNNTSTPVRGTHAGQAFVDKVT